MATANIIWGAAKSGMPVFSSDFQSENVAGGADTNATISAGSLVRVTAVDAAVYVGIGNVPTDDPRLYVPAGASVDIHMAVAGVVAIENA